MDGRVHNLAQIVRRYVGSHTHGNPGRTVEQQVGDLCGKNNCSSILPSSWAPIDRARLCRQETSAYLVSLTRCIAWREGFRIVGTTPVPLTINQGIAIGEILCHQNHGFVGCAIAVRVEFTDHVPDGSC